jgi:integrase
MNRINWPPIARRTNNGKPVLIVDARILINGKRVGPRKIFQLNDPKRAQKEAEGWAKQQRVRREAHGTSSFENHFDSVSPAEKRILLDVLARMRNSVSIEQAVVEFINAKKGAGRSRRYCNELRVRLGRLCTAFEGKTIAQISTADLEGFLTGLNVAAETRNTFRRRFSALWSFADKRGWVQAKTAKDTERAPVVTKSPAILSVEQATALMTESHQDNFTRALHAIGLFAGLRVAEIQKLDWKHVKLAEGWIDLPAEIVKGKKNRRLVPIQANLREWLQPLAKTHGPVLDFYPRTQSRAARKRAGIVAWVTHTARHCYASYRLAQIQNPAQVALECGHDQAVLFEHYRELVKPSDAERYFAIRPQEDKGESKK